MKQRVNACLTCGACCAHFRASFYYQETDEYSACGVPAALTEPLTQFRQMMKGTRHVPPRCVALEGAIGLAVRCTIHPSRSTVCREFPGSYEDDVTPHDRCDQARAAHGLPPLRPEDWWRDDDPPKFDNRPDPAPPDGPPDTAPYSSPDPDPASSPDDFPLRPAA